MRQILFMALLCPLLALAQGVEPVISDDYLKLIRKDSLKTTSIPMDSTNSFQRSELQYFGFNINNPSVRKILTARGQLKLQHVRNRTLTLTGGLLINFEQQYHNRIPAIQEEFVQGRTNGSQLTWQGPETGELFSYGPSRHSLEFDGQAYTYDINGKLVPRGSGNGKPSIVYDNSIFRPANLLSHTYNLAAKYISGYRLIAGLSIKGSNSHEKTIIQHNRNAADYFMTTLESDLLNLGLNATYTYRHERFDHSNRNGFLNRVYQFSLLTPTSFSNQQGAYLPNGQRSYSVNADNPFFLLNDPQHFYSQLQRSGSLSMVKKYGKLKISLSQHLLRKQQAGNESYQPGTAGFPNGVSVDRSTSGSNYNLNTNLRYNVDFDNYKFDADIIVNYIYSNNTSNIRYAKDFVKYHYQRSTQDMSFTFSPDFRYDDGETGMVISNKIYASNTTSRDAFFLPSLAIYSRNDDVFGLDRFSTHVHASYNRFNNELSIERSFATSSLLQIPLAAAFLYQPTTEVRSFDGLAPVRHEEYTAGIELSFNNWHSYKNRLSFTFNWYQRNINDDVFPTWQSGGIQLANMADHRNRGIELQLNWNRYLGSGRKVNLSNSLSFVKYRAVVSSINKGIKYVPIAGFKDVHKALVPGHAPGVIMGNTWKRDDGGKMIIGPDGFPLVNDKVSVIGDPTPDFTLKHNLSVSINNKWTVNADLEWRKGGDTWNGTAAVLDYYGRSELTGTQRNTRQYVFDGVQEDGRHNTIPVDFYNSSLPLYQNRWVRYGVAGVAEQYIQKGDCLRLRLVSVSYVPTIKFLQQLSFSLYANNIILWSPYKGSDPNQLLIDQPGTSGLDFFNLPSSRSFGLNVSFQF